MIGSPKDWWLVRESPAGHHHQWSKTVGKGLAFPVEFVVINDVFWVNKCTKYTYKSRMQIIWTVKLRQHKPAQREIEGIWVNSFQQSVLAILAFASEKSFKSSVIPVFCASLFCVITSHARFAIAFSGHSCISAFLNYFVLHLGVNLGIQRAFYKGPLFYLLVLSWARKLPSLWRSTNQHAVEVSEISKQHEYVDAIVTLRNWTITIRIF